MSLILTGHPFDTIKVRLQKEGTSGKFNGPLSCLTQTVRKEGLKALYKGVTPPLFATGIINSILFGLQGAIIPLIAKSKSVEGATTFEVSQSAILTGGIVSVVVAPIEGIKARLQVQYGANAHELKYKGPVDAFKQIYNKLGLRNGIYRGWLPCAFTRMSNYAYFGSYAYIKSWMTPEGGGKLNMSASVIAGGLAGISYWLSCYPFDVVKNRMMAAADTKVPTYKNMRACFKTIYKHEGIKGFFSGFTPCLLRAFPANAACFVTFEIVMSILP